jgi:hypothetical protein
VRAHALEGTTVVVNHVKQAAKASAVVLGWIDCFEPLRVWERY